MKTLKLMLAAASAVSLFAGCNRMPVIDKEYNPVKIITGESSLTGSFRQGDEVEDAKIVLSYQNGLGREAEVFVPEVNGIYAEPFTVTLAPRSESDNGSGTIEISLTGTPLAGIKTALRPTIKLATHEVFITLETTPLRDIILDAGNSVVSGTFRIFQPVQNGKISVSYNSNHAFAVTINVAEIVGVSGAEFETTLPAAPGGGFIDVPLQGTPSNHGTYNYVVRMVKEGEEYTMTKAINIIGEVTFDIDASIVTGSFIKGEPLSGAFISLAYNADRNMDMAINVDAVDGVSGAPFQYTLNAGSGTVTIPLTGTPASDGEKILTVTMKENNIIYTAQIKVTVAAPGPGIEFEEETFTFNGLTYKTVFIDVNGNGFVNPGDVWLDRNIGATSNDPGTYGAAGANADSFGQLIQWGKPYGAAYDSSYSIDMAATSPWSTICPTGYEVPTIVQWRDAIAKLTGGTVSGNNVTGVDGITEKLMISALKLPLSGWIANGNRDHEQAGLQGAYWTSTEGNNTSPWKVEIKNNTATSTGSNWAGSEWQMAVRCIKTIE